MKAITNILAAAVVAVVMGVCQLAHATLDTAFTLNSGSGTVADPGHYSAGGSGLGQVIPDNTAAGVGYSINFGTAGLTISAISVAFNVSGGYNGDLYAYLSHGSTLVQLLDPNSNLGGAGFNVTMVGGTGNPIPTSGSGVISGTTYTAYQDLAAFNTANPNGAWTLFFADRGPGDVSQLDSFTLSITAVPEPVTLALGLFVAMLLALAGLRWAWQTK